MSKIKICLDAGHIGPVYNQSPVLKTYYESLMNWKLHFLLKSELESLGMEVITTRSEIDVEMDVYDRGAAAKGCDLFMSIHSNACATESVDYPVIYRAYDNLNDVDTLALALAQKIGEVMGTTQAGRTASRQNGSGDEYYGVQRGARAAGAPYYLLIEHSFHTNLKAAIWLSDDNNLGKLAKAEAELIADFFKVKAVPEVKTEIMGQAQATAAQMVSFCRARNPEPKLTSCSLDELAIMFLEEGEAEGVRGDIAFAQSIHETGYFRYGGIVTPDMNNYAGIGALNGNATGNAARFAAPRLGVRAQIQHLKAYACEDALVNDCVDPRFHLVMRGSAPYVEWLGAADNPEGKGWAVPGSGYGGKVLSNLHKILAIQNQTVAPELEPDPLAEYPEWQRESFRYLEELGAFSSPEYWVERFGEQITVGEAMGVFRNIAVAILGQ